MTPHQKLIDAGVRVTYKQIEKNKEFLTLTPKEQAKKIRGYKHYRKKMGYVPDWMEIDKNDPQEVAMAEAMSLKQKFPFMATEKPFNGIAEGQTIVGKGICIHGMTVRNIDTRDLPIVGEITLEIREEKFNDDGILESIILDTYDTWVYQVDAFERVWEIIEQ